MIYCFPQLFDTTISLGFFRLDGLKEKESIDLLILCQGPDFSFSNYAESASSLFALTGDCILRCLIGIVIKYCFFPDREYATKKA